MPALLAAGPVAVILVLMGALRWSAAAAGAVGLLVALALALTRFEIGARTGLATEAALAGALAEAVHATGTILWIILPALALYELQRRAGAIERIRTALAGLTDDRRLQALLVAWFFGLFMEGAAGFGTPVALAAPLLVGIGFPPVRAVALALVGHAAGVSFGAVGTPVLTQVEMTGLDGRGIAAATALLHAITGGVLVVALLWLAGEARPGRRDLGWGALAAMCFFTPSLVLAALAGPELPTLGGALIGGFVFAAFLWSHRPAGAARLPLRRLLADLAPYLIILALVLATRLVPELRAGLGGIVLAWELPGGFRGSFQPFYHPGSMLAAGLLAGAALTGRTGHLGPALAAALGRLAPVALALLAMLALSRVMVHAGMIATLAAEAARAGPVWPLIAPAIGVLGTFVTGSATASNILLTEFQLQTAWTLSLSPVFMAAAQSFGAGVGNVIAPHNIIAGSATVGLRGREGEILALTAPACGLYALAGGALLLAFLWAA